MHPPEAKLSRITRYVSLRRLIVALIVLPALVGLGVLVLRDGDSAEGVSAPALLETPPTEDITAVGLEEGKLAPDFEISTTDGHRVKLSDFRGRPLVVNFHALWCTSCLTELPEIKAAQEERGLDTFAVLAVNSGESRQRALEFVEYLDAPSFTFALDSNLAVSDAYRVRGLPATVFIDSTGVVQSIYFGYTGTDLLNVFLDAAISAEPPGEIPVALRLISSIPRTRALTVQRDGDELVLSSRSLRCDSSYCPENELDELASFIGFEISEKQLTDAHPNLRVRHDPDVITEEQLIDAVAHALQSIEDPVYQGEIEVVRVDDES